MPQETVQVIREFAERLWRRRDVDAALRLVDPDAIFDWRASRAPFSGLYRGHAAVREGWLAAMEAWEEFHPEFEEAIEVGPAAVVLVTSVRARGKGSGVPVQAEGASLWEVREGRIILGKLFQSKEEALEAVGLSNQEPRAS
jgi:ketosteroid isomerase-like protein